MYLQNVCNLNMEAMMLLGDGDNANAAATMQAQMNAQMAMMAQMNLMG